MRHALWVPRSNSVTVFAAAGTAWLTPHDPVAAVAAVDPRVSIE